MLSDFAGKVRRAETPFFRGLKGAAKAVLNPSAPRVPEALKPLFRGLYQFHYLVIIGIRFFVTFLYRQPLFQSRCAAVGRNLMLGGKMPFVTGPVEILLGDDVRFGGNVSILSGGPFPHPTLVMKDRADVGWNVIFSIGQEIVVEEDVRISYDCRISDTDGHPKAADLRAGNAPPTDRDIRPIRICRGAWIGNGVHIMKGVTIGEGAIIGANSVVITDIPPYALALGNPAEVFFRNAGKPQNKNWLD